MNNKSVVSKFSVLCLSALWLSISSAHSSCSDILANYSQIVNETATQVSAMATVAQSANDNTLANNYQDLSKTELAAPTYPALKGDLVYLQTITNSAPADIIDQLTADLNNASDLTHSLSPLIDDWKKGKKSCRVKTGCNLGENMPGCQISSN